MSVIYWCPARNIPTGGVRVIYRHADVMNTLGVDAQIYHWHNPAFACSWFEHQSRIKRDRTLHLKKDFSILPEGVSVEIGQKLHAVGAKYGLFVQNSVYALFGGNHTQAKAVAEAYRAADLILTISDHTTAFVKQVFPQVDVNKIVQLTPSVRGVTPGRKRKIITYMPRKLPRHAGFIEEIGHHLLPPTWKLRSIDKMTQEQVFAHLAESAIFISLSEFEGLGLPPIEAALAGNLVVGYTGEGGDEYFDLPQFTRVHTGDMLGLFKALQDAIVRAEAGVLQSPEMMQANERLRAMYSEEAERQSLMRLKEKIGEVMGQ